MSAYPQTSPEITGVIRIVPTETRYARQMEELTNVVYDLPPGGDTRECLRAEHFRHHVHIFPQGQFVALDGDRVVGLTASMRIDFDPDHPFIEPWPVTISNGWLSRHTPDGAWMYGVESAVHPDYQGRGIGGKLMEARFEVARALNVRGMVAGSTLMDYCKEAHHATPEEYLEGVKVGRFFDGNLTKQMKKGFVPLALIPNYVTDPCSLGWGAVIVWYNPDYDPAIGPRRDLPPGFAPKTYTAVLKPKR